MESSTASWMKGTGSPARRHRAPRVAQAKAGVRVDHNGGALEVCGVAGLDQMEIRPLSFVPGYSGSFDATAGGALLPGAVAAGGPAPSDFADKVVAGARSDIGMEYDLAPRHPGHNGRQTGCCADLASDAYAAAGFDLSKAVYTDISLHPNHYSGLAPITLGPRNANTLMRYFQRTQDFMSNHQSFQVGDLVWFNWSGGSTADHVAVVSKVDATGRPLAVVEATNYGVPAHEDTLDSYQLSHMIGHGRLASAAPAPEPAPTPRPAPRPSDRNYTVRQGDTLSGIAGSVLGDASRWREIYDLNKDRISDPNLIFPGEVLRLPSAPSPSPAPAPQPSPAPQAPSAPSSRPAPVAQAPSAPSQPSAPALPGSNPAPQPAPIAAVPGHPGDGIAASLRFGGSLIRTVQESSAAVDVSRGIAAGSMGGVLRMGVPEVFDLLKGNFLTSAATAFVSNLYELFKGEETPGQAVSNFAVDTAAYTGIGAAATAIGGAIGSLVPGIGTLLGVAAGAAVGAGLSWLYEKFLRPKAGATVAQALGLS